MLKLELKVPEIIANYGYNFFTEYFIATYFQAGDRICRITLPEMGSQRVHQKNPVARRYV
jgi:hypothetical protein